MVGAVRRCISGGVLFCSHRIAADIHQNPFGFLTVVLGNFIALCLRLARPLHAVGFLAFEALAAKNGVPTNDPPARVPNHLRDIRFSPGGGGICE